METKPRRTRRRIPWFKAIAALLLLSIGAMVTAYFVWGGRTARGLEAAHAALRAAGEPVTAADLVEPSVTADRNAALLLRKAARSIDTDSESWAAYYKRDALPEGSRLPLSDEERKLLRKVVNENAEALELAARAAQLDGVDWRLDYTVGLINLNVKDWNEQRQLVNLLDAAARLAHDAGDDARALELAGQMRVVARAVGTQPLLIGSLVSIGCEAMQVALLADIAPTLRISSDGDPRAASPEQVRRTIDALLDDAPRAATLRRGMRGARVMQQDVMQDLLDGRLSLPAVLGPAAPPAPPSAGARLMGRVLTPVLRENALLMLEHMNGVIAQLDAPDWQAFQARVPGEPPQIKRSPARYHLAAMLLPALARAPQTRYRLANDARLAAAALAIRWYAVEHDGRLPESLDELVPRYLPAVPPDALAGNGKLIGYVRDDDRPRVYHVGENFVDDAGREPDFWATQRENQRLSDRVVHLKHQPRPTTTSADE